MAYKVPIKILVSFIFVIVTTAQPVQGQTPPEIINQIRKYEDKYNHIRVVYLLDVFKEHEDGSISSIMEGGGPGEAMYCALGDYERLDIPAEHDTCYISDHKKVLITTDGEKWFQDYSPGFFHSMNLLTPFASNNGETGKDLTVTEAEDGVLVSWSLPRYSYISFEVEYESFEGGLRPVSFCKYSKTMPNSPVEKVEQVGYEYDEAGLPTRIEDAQLDSKHTPVIKIKSIEFEPQFPWGHFAMSSFSSNLHWVIGGAGLILVCFVGYYMRQLFDRKRPV